ncbi:putative phage tail protein [Pseudomonas sp. PNP]|uniref:putative phage tail protein n=1 Tax=Pseudomonas sp. PNP TaxID=361819 RepID=UPI001AEC764F|nr:putative phage tail protein [Pseudomonas sp. PNP]MBP2840430.1 DUF2313 domain-containing protein [Pseudomonas sp. PNP]
MAMTVDDYREQLRQLLPPGPAFDPELQPDWAQMLASLAPELARVDEALDGLQREMNPATVVALLPDWENYLGLPDACVVPGSQSFEQRGQAVLDKLTATGAPQLGYYRKLGEQSGLPIFIEEFRPARVGPICVGDFLYGPDWLWAWRAAAPVDGYGTDEAAELDCRLQHQAPAYTDVVLSFGRDQVETLATQVDQLFNAVHYVLPAAMGGFEV